MRVVLRIGFFAIALVTAVAMLGGCGGGGGSSHATARLHALAHYRCEVFGVEHQLRALEAGISATKREFDAANPGPARQQILRSMEENARLIHKQLPSLEQCAQNALHEAEGKPAHKPLLPPEPTVVAHRIGPPRVEPGEQGLPASPCSPYGKNRTTTVYIYPETSGCARVAPGERLRVANLTGIGSPAEAVAVRVFVGDYELWLGPHQEGVIPAPVQTYFGRGTHSVHAVGGIGPTVLLLPRVCAIRPPAKPGEELCFR
jgi:hypothetical protein